jgi:hypothetical protein
MIEIIPSSSSYKLSLNNFDSDQRFGWTVQVSVSFTLLSLSIGGDAVTTGLEDLRDIFFNEQKPIKIGCDCFDSPRIISLDSDARLRTHHETATLVFEQDYPNDPGYSGPLQSLADVIKIGHLLSGFSESFSFSKSANSYSFSRSVDFGLKRTILSDCDAQNSFLNLVQTLRAVYLNSRPAYGYIPDETAGEYSFDQLRLKSKLSESIDLLE